MSSQPPSRTPDPLDPASSDLSTIDLGAASKPSQDATPSVAAFGRYIVTGQLGAGNFGNVYRGWDPDLKRDVAIKVAKRERVASTGQADRFLEEARTMAAIDHPGIIPVFDCGQTESGECFIVSKLIEGADLHAQMQNRRYSIEEASRMVATVAEALHAVHRHGVVHRDIKPANILIDGNGRPLVGDFGLALSPQTFGMGPDFCGTAAYMSPEQAQSRADKVDARSDIYSLGVILFELATGKRPYRSTSAASLLREIADELTPVQPPRQIAESVPAALERIILKALAKRPPDRYTTAHDLAADLRSFLAALSPSAARRRIAMLAGLAVLVIALFGVAKLARNALFPSSHPPTIASVAEASVRIEAMEIQQLILDDRGDHVRRGVLLKNRCVLREGDGVQLRARLSRPAYCYWLAYLPDGVEQICFPADLNAPPVLTAEPAYPWRESERDDTFFGFQEGPGWQAFLLVVSRKPLPSFAQWRKSRGPAPWRSNRALTQEILRHDGRWLESFALAATNRSRGKGERFHAADGGLPGLIRWANNDGKDENIVAVEAWAVPILPRSEAAANEFN